MYPRCEFCHICSYLVAIIAIGSGDSSEIIEQFSFRGYKCVGFGPYWAAFTSYCWNKEEERAALAIASEAARRVNLPFLVLVNNGLWGRALTEEFIPYLENRFHLMVLISA
jgi:hypothetical protein